MEIAVTRTSPNLFDLLGVELALGRGFAPDEIGKAREQVIVLTHGLWNRLGADPAIVGTDVRLQGRPFTVIGVLPPEFTFVRNEPAGPPQPVEAFIPLPVELAQTNANGAYAAIIRARRGASPEAGGRRGRRGRPRRRRPRLQRPRTEAVSGGPEGRRRLADSPRARRARRGGARSPVHADGEPRVGAAGARGAARARGGRVARARRQHDRHRALDAPRRRLLGAAGGALGTLAAVWGTRALVAVAPLDLPRREAIAIDWRIGATVIAVGGLLGLLAAVVPGGVGGADIAIVASREQRRPRRRRARPPAPRHDRGAGGALARAAQQRRARRAQLRAPASRRSGLQVRRGVHHPSAASAGILSAR